MEVFLNWVSPKSKVEANLRPLIIPGSVKCEANLRVLLLLKVAPWLPWGLGPCFPGIPDKMLDHKDIHETSTFESFDLLISTSADSVVVLGLLFHFFLLQVLTREPGNKFLDVLGAGNIKKTPLGNPNVGVLCSDKPHIWPIEIYRSLEMDEMGCSLVIVFLRSSWQASMTPSPFTSISPIILASVTYMAVVAWNDAEWCLGVLPYTPFPQKITETITHPYHTHIKSK